MIGARLCGVLFVISVCGGFSSIVVKGARKDPVGSVVGGLVANPLDVVEEMAVMSNAIVLGVYDAFDEVFRVAVSDERRGRLVAIFEDIGVLGFQLGYMEDRMDANCDGKVKGEGHGRWLRDNRKGANFLPR